MLSHSGVSNSLRPRFSGKNTGVGCHALLQGILPTQDRTESLNPPVLGGRLFTSGVTRKAPTACLSLNLCSHETLFPQETSPGTSAPRNIFWEMLVYPFSA